MSTLDEIFGDGAGAKDLAELKQAHRDVKKLKKIGGGKKKKAKKD